MSSLKEKFAEKARISAEEIKAFVQAHKDTQVDTVSVEQVFGGSRDIITMLYETSEVSPDYGIRFRGYAIPELRQLLPKAKGCSEPLPEGIFYLMLVGEIPTDEDVQAISEEWRKRSEVPSYVFELIRSMPADSHPMQLFGLAIKAMQNQSIFNQKYAEGLKKTDYWDPIYEDAMNLIARLPRIAAYIYRHLFHKGNHIAPDPTLDWAANFAHMLGVNNSPDFKSLMRLYLTIHADHEGGNASAHAVHLVGSTLADPYSSFAAGMDALGGPLHGLANQEVIKWLFEMQEVIGSLSPSEEQIEEYIRQTLAQKRVVPGYGHAVLRVTDPRFVAQAEFAKRYCPNNNMVQTVWRVYNVAPRVLGESGRIKNPFPNVDAHSGALLINYGMTEYNFYTVLFGVSRALGVMAALCWSRMLGMPIERPRSVTFEWLKANVPS